MKNLQQCLMVGAAALVWSTCTLFAAETDKPLHEAHCARLDRLAQLIEGGVTNTYFYDAEGRVSSITNSRGRIETFIYDPERHPQTLTRITTQPIPGQSDPFSDTNVFLLGRHALATSDSTGTTYEYDEHQFLVRRISPSSTETRTIVDGNIAQIVFTGVLAGTDYYTYTSIEPCLAPVFPFLGRGFRNYPASLLAVRSSGLVVAITYDYGLDALGRVSSRTATINENGNIRTNVTYYGYQ